MRIKKSINNIHTYCEILQIFVICQVLQKHQSDSRLNIHQTLDSAFGQKLTLVGRLIGGNSYALDSYSSSNRACDSFNLLRFFV